MTIYLRKDTASQEILIGPMISSTDGITPTTGAIANTDIIIWKAGGTTVAAKNSGGATHISGGRYYATLDDTDTNTLGSMVIEVTLAGSLMWRGEFAVLAANVYDSWFSTDILQVDLIQVNGAAQTATLDTIKAETALIVEDTGTTLPGTLATIAGYVDTEVASILAAVDTEIGTLGTELAKVPKSDGTATWNSTALGSIQSECTDALNAYDAPTKAELDTGLDALPTAAEIKTAIEAAGSSLASILEDTAVIGALGAGLTAIPWNAAWDAEVQSEVADALAAYDPPTNAEMEARTLVAANYFDPAADVVAHVTLVDTCTTNTDMRGTNSAALASVCTEGRLAELDAANIPADVDAILTDTGTTLDGKLNTIDGIVDKILPFTYQHYKITVPVFSVTGKMTSCTKTRYPTKADADAGTNGVAYAVTATYDGDDNLATYNEVATS